MSHASGSLPTRLLGAGAEQVAQSKVGAVAHSGLGGSKLLGQAARFQLRTHEVTAALADVVKAIQKWRSVALSANVGLTQSELEDFAPAFEHDGLEEALALLR